MFLSRNKKNNVYSCKPHFDYIKVRFKGGQSYIGMFCDVKESMQEEVKLVKIYSFF